MSMQLDFIGGNIEITPALKTLTLEKFKRFERRHANLHINVTFHVDNVTHVAEGNIIIDGTEIHASAKSADMYSAIDDLVDKLIAQVTKHKEKLLEHR